jgi:hypothetical protein
LQPEVRLDDELLIFHIKLDFLLAPARLLLIAPVRLGERLIRSCLRRGCGHERDPNRIDRCAHLLPSILRSANRRANVPCLHRLSK